MKKQVILLLVCLMCALNGWAQEVVIDKIHYSVNEDGTEAYVSKADPDITDVNILPRVTIEGTEYEVTRIGYCAFEHCGQVSSVILPEGIKALSDWWIFADIPLTELYIPSTCVEIVNLAMFPPTLRTITISEDNPVYYSENNCIISREKKELLFMPVGEEFPLGIEAIGPFCSFEEKSELIIPNSVTTIEGRAFLANIGTVYIPNSVINITGRPFDSSVTHIIVDNDNPVYYSKDDCLIAKHYKLLIQAGKSAIVPAEVGMIGSGALHGHDKVVVWNQEYPYTPKYEWICDSPYGELLFLQVPQGSIPRYLYSGWFSFDTGIEAITDGTSTFYLRDEGDTWYAPHIDRLSANAGDEIELSVVLNSDQPVIGFQFDLYLPDGITVTTDEDDFEDIYLSTARTTARKHTLTSQQQADGSWRILCYSSSNSAFEGTEGEVCTINVKIDDNLPESSYPIVFKNIVTSYMGGDGNKQQIERDPVKTYIYLLPEPEPYSKKLGSGDATDDGTVNVNDITSVVSFILGNNPAIFDFWQADVDMNGKIQVGDITGVVDIILNGSTLPNGLRHRHARRQTSGEGSEQTNPTVEIIPFAITPGEVKEVEVMLNNPNDSFCGLQFDITLPEGIELVSDEIGYVVELGSRTTTRKHTIEAQQQADSSIRVLAYSNKNYTFSGEEGDVVILTVKAADNLSAGVYNLSMKNIVLSRPDITQAELSDYEGSILSGTLADNPVIKGDITADAATVISSALTESVTHIDLTQAVKVAQDAVFTTANPNTLILTPASTQNTNKNIIAGDVCANLILTDAFAFASPKAFTANHISFSTDVNTYKTLTLPFNATLPTGFTALNAATVNETSVILQGTSGISANSPVVIKGTGNLELTVSNATVSATTDANLVDGILCGTYKGVTAPIGSYVLQKHSGVIGFYQVEGVQPTINAFRAYMNAPVSSNVKAYSLVIEDDATAISITPAEKEETVYYNVAGQRMSKAQKGINIHKGKKVFYK